MEQMMAFMAYGQTAYVPKMRQSKEIEMVLASSDAIKIFLFSKVFSQ